jgi:hypothetical protein
MATNEQVDINFLAKLDDIIESMIEYGGLLTVGTKGCGKSDANKWIVRRIMQSKKHETNEYKTIIFDDCSNWKWRYDTIPFINYDMRGLPLAQDLIVNLAMIDPNDCKNAIGQIMMNEFQHKMDLKEQLSGSIPFNSIFFVEEIQCIWGRFGLSGISGRFNMKMVSEGRNYGMTVCGIGQRFSDIDTRICERIRFYLLGATSGANDLSKIRKIGGKEVADVVNTLDRGQFCYFDKDDQKIEIIGFPKFESVGKPYEVVLDSSKGFVKVLYKGK